MAVIANLEARYSANVISFERELKKLQAVNARAADRIIGDSKRAAKGSHDAFANANLGGAIRRSMGGGLAGLKADLAGMAAGIAGAVSVASAIGLADTYTRFSNSLKVAGLEGQNLKAVQDRLFASAVQNGVAVETLGQLYGRVALASRELGVSQTQTLQLTDAVTAAIRVSGGTAESSSGAMLQLAQALGSGTVRAEEFNSILEGIPALANAAAAASTTYAGSVAKMRADVIAGKLSSKELFDLILAGSTQLQAQAAKAPLTVAQGFENLKTAMIQFIGQTNETWGITDRLAQALGFLAENIDMVVQSLSVLVGVLAVTMAPAIGRAAIGMASYAAATGAASLATIRSIPGVIGLSAGLTGVSTGAAAASLGLKMLMSATGVGLAIVALTTVIGYFTVQNYKAAEATRQMRQRVEEKSAALRASREAANQARVNTGDLTTAELEAATAAAALTGEQGKLENAYYRVAAAAKAAELAQARADRASAFRDRETAREDYDERYRNEQRRVRQPGITRNGRMDGGYDVAISPVEANRRAAERARRTQEARVFRNADEVYRAEDARVREIEQRKLETFSPPRTGGGGGGERASRGGGSSGPSAEGRQRNADQALDQANRALRDALRAQADTVEERHQAAVQALGDDLAMAREAIDQRVTQGEITQEVGDQLKAIEDQRHTVLIATENARRAAEVEATRQRVAEELLSAEEEAARLQEDALVFLASQADTLEERHAYEREALAVRQAIDDRMFAAQQDSLRLELEKQNATQAEIDRILAANQANRDRAKADQSGQLGSRQDRENGPQSIREWIAEFTNATSAGESLNQKLFSIAEGGIAAITDGLTDAIMGTKSFAEAFKDMAKQMIAQLVKLAIQFVIFEMIGRAFGIPGLGRVAIGLQQNAGKVGNNAMGTNNWSGGLTWVGEKGPELVNLQKGAGVIPNHELRSAMRVGALGGKNTSPVYNLTTIVRADGAVMRDDIRHEIAQANIATLQQAKRMNDALAMRGRNILR